MLEIASAICLASVNDSNMSGLRAWEDYCSFRLRSAWSMDHAVVRKERFNVPATYGDWLGLWSTGAISHQQVT